jgi:hypothetical protein
VVEVAEEVVWEELLSGAKLAAGSVGWGTIGVGYYVEVLVEEDDDEEIPSPSFTSQRYGQALGVGGARGPGAPFGPVGQLGATHR